MATTRATRSPRVAPRDARRSVMGTTMSRKPAQKSGTAPDSPWRDRASPATMPSTPIAPSRMSRAIQVRDAGRASRAGLAGPGGSTGLATGGRAATPAGGMNTGTAPVPATRQGRSRAVPGAALAGRRAHRPTPDDAGVAAAWLGARPSRSRR